MASGTAVGGDGGGNDEPKEKQGCSEVKVYRRKAFKGPRNNLGNIVANGSAKENSANGTSLTGATTGTGATDPTGSVKDTADSSGNASEPQALDPTGSVLSRDDNSENASEPQALRSEDTSSIQPRNDESSKLSEPQPMVLEDTSSVQPRNDESSNVSEPQPMVLEDSNSAQPREDESSKVSEPQPMVLEDTNSAKLRDDESSKVSEPQPMVVEDTETAQPRENDSSKASEPQALVLEDADNARTRDGDPSKASESQALVLEDRDSAQPVDDSSKASEVQAVVAEDADCAQPRDDASVKDAEVQTLVSERTDSAQPGDGDSIKLSEPQSVVLENTDSVQLQQQLPEQAEHTELERRQELEPQSGKKEREQQQHPPLRVDVTSDDCYSLHRQQVDAAASGRGVDEPVGDGVRREGPDGRIKINLASVSKQEMREIRKKLQNELNTVKMLVKRIEAKQGQLGASTLNISPPLRRTVLDRGLVRAASDIGVHREVTTPLPRQTRPLHQLSVSVLQNNQGVGENVEKEKRTPKANQFYRNSEFLLAKDKFPPAESNKKSKSNRFGSNHKIFRSCSSVLDKLMKHKHGWVFNTPVDVEGLRLHDYFTIIKNPMDLGTVKARLNKNWYKSPEEFAEDVRLTFHNAMRYNPKGQDVHIMAEQLLRIFEERWAVIKSDHDRETRLATYDMGFPTPTSRKVPALSLPSLDMRRILDRSESMTYPPIDIRQRPVVTTPSSRTPAPKKPKAKDPHKRDMTYEEKQKLSTNLQSLPSDKLDNIVQIIKKRNSALSQHDDEIEVDIDSVDAETLWELERFVTNYKKNLSKHKRKAELALQARAEVEPNLQQKAPTSSAADLPKGTKEGEKNLATSSPVQAEKQAANEARSSSSSSSSSDSGSSSSDSDSDSSSASGSDVGH